MSMELLMELLFTGVVAVLFSFLIAKLVSRSMAGDSSHDSQIVSSKNGDEEITSDVDEEVIMEELKNSERLEVQGFQSDKRVEFVGESGEQMQEKIDEFVGEPILVEEVAKSMNRDDIIEAECFELTQKSVEEGLKREEKSSEEMLGNEEEFESEENREFGVKLADATNIMEQSEKIMGKKEVDPKEVKEANSDQLLKENREEEPIGIELAVEKPEGIRVVESELKEKVEEKRVEIDSDEDDWEGIERSELEKVFAEAAKFVELADKDDRLTSVGSDVRMELHGLHKVATEGSCREQPPMALKVSARAKWNAWQRLGNMSPDVAMEQYINLVLERVPGWMEEKSTGEGNPGSYEAANLGAVAPDLITLSSHQPNVTDDRNPELEPGEVESDSTADPNSENRANE